MTKEHFLFREIEMGNKAAVWQAIKSGIDVAAIRNDNNDTLLIQAARYGCTRCVKLLIQAGCDVNAQNNDQNTALNLAAVQGYCLVACYLLQANANTDLANKNGLNPLQTAYHFRKTRMHDMFIRLLEEAIDTPAPSRIIKAFTENRFGADINQILTEEIAIKKRG